MQRLDANIFQYCEQWSSPPDAILNELERETHLKTLAPQMLSGALQGQLLRLLSQLQSPKSVLEIGTFTGYATICLARGLARNGKVRTIEANPELEYLIRKYLKKAGLQNQVELFIGDAMKVIPQLEGRFDLVFIDAGKQYYQAYYDLIIDRVEPGGLIISDNVLWSGKVATDLRETDADTKKLHAFNVSLQEDERVDNLLLPIRDGLLVARKR
ncbi:MAG: O-methyltransferase [Phaeodactylibacter sp.]|nr:O-methyltransferase [Phaeodactylibacter sp.]